MKLNHINFKLANLDKVLEIYKKIGLPKSTFI